MNKLRSNAPSWPLVALMLGALLTLLACASSEPEPPRPPLPQLAEHAPVDVTLDLDPRAVRTLTAAAKLASGGLLLVCDPGAASSLLDLQIGPLMELRTKYSSSDILRETSNQVRSRKSDREISRGEFERTVVHYSDTNDLRITCKVEIEFRDRFFCNRDSIDVERILGVRRQSTLTTGHPAYDDYGFEYKNQFGTSLIALGTSRSNCENTITIWSRHAKPNQPE